MSTRLIVNGRVVYESRDAHAPAVISAPRSALVETRRGDIVPMAVQKLGPSRGYVKTPDIHGVIHEVPPPIPEDSRESPFRSGRLFECPVDRMAFHVLPADRLTPKLGWASAGFWLSRWKGCKYAELLELCQAGLMHPAIIEGSGLKRFRCVDERQVLAFKFLVRKKTAEGESGLVPIDAKKLWLARHQDKVTNDRRKRYSTIRE